MSKIKRRYFVLGGIGAMGALVVGWSATPVRQRLTPGSPLAVGVGQVALNGWVKVSADNTVTVVMSQAEMGQGTHTGVAMLLAEEMDAAWSQVRLEAATFDGIYNNQSAIVDALPFHPDEGGATKTVTRHLARKILRELPGLAGTGGSSSITDQWLPMRAAGASARAMLVQAAAMQWNVAAGECSVAEGKVSHPSGRSLTFGELAPAASSVRVPQGVLLKNPAAFKLIGRPVRRLDNAAKLDGSAVYGIDAMPPGMLYAAMMMCPTLGGKVLRVDSWAAASGRGVSKIVVLAPVAGGLGSVGNTSGGVAVVADTPYHAMQAAKQLAVEWDHGAASTTSSKEILGALSLALDGEPGHVHFARGAVDAAMQSAAKVIEAEYRVPFLAHAPMEPMNCTAQFKNGMATVWVGTQAAGFTRSAVAKALNIQVDRVEVRSAFLGGAFGRRYLNDAVVQAALIAKEVAGLPVQLLWSREQDIAHDYYRPAYVARCKAGFDANGNLVAWRTGTAGSSMGAPSFLDNSTEGASDTAYSFPNAVATHRTLDSAVTMGIWRSVAHSQNGFFIESFIDECATAAGKDPLEFRASLLAGNSRHLRVLHRAAELSGWSRPLGDAADGTKRARGVAIHRAFNAIVAQVAEVSLSADREIRVQRVVCVVDCGFPVNPNLIRQQMEGAIVFGLSAALKGEITIENGQVQQSNFHDYAPLRMAECPVIEVDILPSDEPPGGVGEPGTPPVAPAVANAIFALTGQRLRALPLKLA